MVAKPVRMLLLLSIAALLVEGVDALGWWQWMATTSVVRVDPEGGALRLATSRALGLPSAVAWSRRLSGSDLRGAQSATVTAALERVGRRQRRWMPTDSDGPKNQASAAVLSGDLEAAQQLMQAALDRDPTSPYLNQVMAILLRRAGRTEESLHYLSEARALVPGYNQPAVELTPEEVELVRLDSLHRRVALYPRQSADALIALAGELRRQGRKDEALQVLEPVRKDPTVLLWLAENDLADGDPQSALDRAGGIAASTLFPDLVRARALALVARARDELGDAAGAAAAADEAVRLRPDSAAPYLALASMARRRGDLDSALSYLRRGMGVDPTNVGLLLSFAATAERTGKSSDARFALQRATELAPDRPDVAARLVDQLMRHGELMDATLRLSRFLERFPTDPKLIAQAEQLRRRVTEPPRAK